jgi:hypothetical protein
MFRTLTGFALAVLLAAPASASPFTWLVKGHITDVTPAGGIPPDIPPTPYDGMFSVGQSFSWWITMESTSPDYEPDSDCGQYTPITAMRFASGSVNLSISTTPGQDYFVNPAGGGGFCPIPDDLARLRSDFGTGLFFGMHFWGNFATDALPVSTAGIGQGGILDLTYGGPPGGPDSGYRVAGGTITSITNVPEPAELLLLSAGVLAAVRRIRRTPGRKAEARMT